MDILVSMVILSYNKMDYTRGCLESIRSYTKNVSYEIIVIDNGSDDDTIQYLKEQKDIQLVLNEVNKGFAGGCNQGIQAAKGKYILLLNNDTIVTKNWLFNMVSLLENNDDIAMTGPLTNATVGKQMIEVPYGDDMEKMQRFAENIALQECNPWRTLRLVAFCLLIRRSVIDEIGMLDEKFVVGNYEDDDFNIRMLLADKKAYICRNSFIHHFMNVSFQQKDMKREAIKQKNKEYLEEKWDSMDWNHYADFNKYMLEKIVQHQGRKILHIGCGIGALEIELKDRDEQYYIEGVEEHPVRKRIAVKFLDKMCSYESLEENRNSQETYDVIIIEGMMEKKGIELLDVISSYRNTHTLILLRVFNINHITTFEKLLTGDVGGKLLCAVSSSFRYHYGRELCDDIKEKGYDIIEVREVIKSFSSRQQEIYECNSKWLGENADVKVYNRIYIIKMNTG
ncbi:MAG: glycosyltransferase [Lachnospiraceae bacterium]|nr:glycosyltransferase [Lachnospiraceae bacterium]